MLDSNKWLGNYWVGQAPFLKYWGGGGGGGGGEGTAPPPVPMKNDGYCIKIPIWHNQALNTCTRSTHDIMLYMQNTMSTSDRRTNVLCSKTLTHLSQLISSSTRAGTEVKAVISMDHTSVSQNCLQVLNNTMFGQHSCLPTHKGKCCAHAIPQWVSP